MDPQADCEFCKMAYGFEEPRKESIFATDNFLAFWKDAEQKEILIVDKRHGWDPHITLEYPSPGKEADLKKATERACDLLRSLHPKMMISWRMRGNYNKNSPHFTRLVKSFPVPPGYGW
jgi:hypothetical protein